MNSAPPRIALWLLERWGPRPRRESLIGDLTEESASRSAWWCWRQAVAAISTGIVQDVLTERWTVASGLVVCHGLLAAWGALVWAGWEVLGVAVWNWTVVHEWDSLRAVIWGTGVAPVLGAQVIGAVTVGWIVSRSCSRAAPAAVVTSAASVAATSAALGVWHFGPVGYVGVLVAYPIQSLSLPGVVAGILAGGLLGTTIDSASAPEASSRRA